MMVRRRFTAFVQNQLASAMVVGLGAFVLVVALRGFGQLERLELIAYDYFLNWRPKVEAPNARISLVTAVEQDLVRLDWPLRDELLADVLERIIAQRPRAIGVDIYRDHPRPPGHERLNDVLVKNTNVFWVMKFGTKDEPGIAAPKVLAGSNQVGLADVIVDPDGIARRGVLFLDNGTELQYSLGLRLALAYLEPMKILPEAGEPDPQHMKIGKKTLRPFESHDGGYVNADAGGYQLLLDYRDGPFVQYSVGRVLAGDVPGDAFRDRIVLIGVTAESVKDYFFTPLTTTNAQNDPRMFGVEVHARLSSQVLRAALEGEDFVRSLDDWQESAWILLWALLGAYLGFRIRALWRFSLMMLVGTAVLSGVALAAFSGGWWIPIVPCALVSVLAATSVTSYISYQEKSMRGVLMHLFARHVSTSVANVIWQQRDQLIEGGRIRPQKLTASVLFSDLQGYTSMSEAHEAQEVMDWLNMYMEAMVGVIIANNGTIDKFIGDSIMAVFGAPIPSSTEAEIRRDAANAVRSALAMEKELLRLNEGWREKGYPVAGMRIGIYTGQLVAGSLGSALRSEYTLIGDTVNIASRLESFDKTVSVGPSESVCRILIGGATLDLLGDEFETLRVGSVHLKGKEASMDIYQVLGMAKSRAEEQMSEVA